MTAASAAAGAVEAASSSGDGQKGRRTMKDIISELQDVKTLKDVGAIDSPEFVRLKASLLDGY